MPAKKSVTRRKASSSKASKPTAKSTKVESSEISALRTARKHLEKALELNSDYAEAHFNLANLLVKLGEHDTARTPTHIASLLAFSHF